MRASLSVTFRPPEDLAGPGLVLEQVPVETGRVTRLDLVRALSSRLYGGSGPKIDCGIKNGEFVTAVLIYPDDPAMSYQAGVTWGRLSRPVVTEVEVTESLQFSLTDRAVTKYPVQDLLSLEILSACWDAAGGAIQPPAVTWDGTSIHLATKIYGSLEIKYITVRHAMTLYIPARDNVDENFFESVAWADWTGGAKLLDLQVPTTRHGNDDGCAWRLLSTTVVDFPADKIAPPTADAARRYKVIDYCTQKAKSDETY